MADVGSKFEENTPGKFYVDEECIDCDLCREIAPTIFHRNDDGGYSFVAKQPEGEEEARPGAGRAEVGYCVSSELQMRAAVPSDLRWAFAAALGVRPH